MTDTPAPPTAPAPAFEEIAFGRLLADVGPAAIGRMTALLVRDLAHHITALETAFADARWADVAAHAHALRPSAYAFGFGRLTETLLTLELGACHGNDDCARPTPAHLTALMAANAEIQPILEQLKLRYPVEMA